MITVTVDQIVDWFQNVKWMIEEWPREQIAAFSIFVQNSSANIFDLLTYEPAPIRLRIQCGIRMLSMTQRSQFALWCERHTTGLTARSVECIRNEVANIVLATHAGDDRRSADLVGFLAMNIVFYNNCRAFNVFDNDLLSEILRMLRETL